MKKKTPSLVTLVTSAHLYKVQMAKNMLAAEGINSYIIDEHINLAYHRSFVEGIRLQVNEEDFERAKGILTDSKIFED
jgi:hypothetical protein